MSEQYAKENPDECIIVCDPDDFIVCDICNKDINEKYIHINEWGAYCPNCREPAIEKRTM